MGKTAYRWQHLYAVPTAYEKIKNKATKKKVKAVMNTGIDEYLVNNVIDLIGERFI